MDDIVLTPIQLVSILGMSQALYALVYMAFRAGRLSRAGLAILYFLVLFGGFFYDLAYPLLSEIWSRDFDYSWLLWFFLPSLSYLLILQVTKIPNIISPKHYLVLGLPIMALFIGNNILTGVDALYLMGLISGTLSLLFVWFNASSFRVSLHEGKEGSARYWLVICLIVVNIAFLASVLLMLFDIIDYGEWVSLRNILGLGFVYLASTSLFRIYPQAVLIKERRSIDSSNSEYRRIVSGLKRLLEIDKVYQEPKYGRKDFAQELNVSEVKISQIINEQYNKTIPQILNDLRVDEAKGLLKDTNISIQIIATEVGFNSLTTFNRVFKEIVGTPPSSFRARI